MGSLPRFDLLWANYPDDDDPEAVKRMIGGGVDRPWITNTCAIRMSYALDRAGSPIPRGYPGLSTVQGADGRWYAFRVRELVRYLEREFAPAHVSGTSKPEFQGRRGILVFEVDGWNDATGHIDVWNGDRTRLAEYWARARRVRLWICQ